MQWTVDTMLAIESLASESDVFVGVFVGRIPSLGHETLALLGLQNFVPELNF